MQSLTNRMWFGVAITTAAVALTSATYYSNKHKRQAETSGIQNETSVPANEDEQMNESENDSPSTASPQEANETTIDPPKKRYDPSKATKTNRKTIHLACGCFWSVELRYQRMPGVYSVRVGYTQGTTDSPVYADVKTGKSGHVEACEIVYDPSLVSFEEILEVFWTKHDATSKNKQGNDKGTQYRSGIYYSDSEQCEIALASKEEQVKKLKKPWLKIHTEIKEQAEFYYAEEYHQGYLEKGGRHGKKQSAEKMCSDPIRCYG